MKTKNCQKKPRCLVSFVFSIREDLEYFQTMPRSQVSWKTLKKSKLEPAAPFFRLLKLRSDTGVVTDTPTLMCSMMKICPDACADVTAWPPLHATPLSLLLLLLPLSCEPFLVTSQLAFEIFTPVPNQVGGVSTCAPFFYLVNCAVNIYVTLSALCHSMLVDRCWKIFVRNEEEKKQLCSIISSNGPVPQQNPTFVSAKEVFEWNTVNNNSCFSSSLFKFVVCSTWLSLTISCCSCLHF